MNTASDIARNTLIAISENQKLNDEHVMFLMEILKTRQTRLFTKKNTICNIHVVDSQLIKLFMNALKESSSPSSSSPSIGMDGDDDDDDNDIVERPKKRAKKTVMNAECKRHLKSISIYFKRAVKESDAIIIFPLNYDDHWSLLVYVVNTQLWFYTDSMRNLHKFRVTRLIVTLSELLHVGTKVLDVNTFFDQHSNWECGQYMVLFAGIFMDCACELSKNDTSDLMLMVKNLTAESSKRAMVMSSIKHLLKECC